MKSAILLLPLALALTTEAYAQTPPLGQCPEGASSCIVVTMTPDEVKSLTMPGGVFDQAEWANRSGMSGAVAAWRQKLSTSPIGTMPQVNKGETDKK